MYSDLTNAGNHFQFLNNHCVDPEMRTLPKVERPCVTVPVLVAGLQYKYAVNVTCADEEGGAEPIQVFVCGSLSIVPMISAVVNMPLSDITVDE